MHEKASLATSNSDVPQSLDAGDDVSECSAFIERYHLHGNVLMTLLLLHSTVLFKIVMAVSTEVCVATTPMCAVDDACRGASYEASKKLLNSKCSINAVQSANLYIAWECRFVNKVEQL